MDLSLTKKKIQEYNEKNEEKTVEAEIKAIVHFQRAG